MNPRSFLRPGPLSASLAAGVLLCSTAVRAQVIATGPEPARHSEPERELPKLWVPTEFALGGLLGVSNPAYMAFSLRVFGVHLEWPSGAVILVPRFARGAALDGSADDFVQIDVALGGRYMLSPTRTSVFVGVGMTYGLTDIADKAGYWNTTRGYGAGCYAEVGWAFFRSAWYQLSVGLRVDAPFYREFDRHVDPPGATPTESGARPTGSDYVVPIGLEVSWNPPWPMLL